MPLTLDGTKGETFPSWTTGTRPATPNAGQTGYNTTLNTLETYNGSAWAAAVVLPSGTTSLAPLTFQSGTNLTTATAGVMEYDGKVPYITPQGTQRGVVPGMQYYRLDSAYAGTRATTAQGIFAAGSGSGIGVTLSGSTVYEFEANIGMSKTAGTTNHTTNFAFGGTATLNNIGFIFFSSYNYTSFASAALSTIGYLYLNSASSFNDAYGNWATAGIYRNIIIRGTVSVNAGGTFIPQYILSADPGGAYTTAAGSYFKIYPVGASGANVSVGTWA